MLGSKEDLDVVISALQSMLEYNKESVRKRWKQLDKVISQEELSESEGHMITEATQILQVLNSQSVRDNELLFAKKKIFISKSTTEKDLMQLEVNPLLQRNEKIEKRIKELQDEVQHAKQQYKELQEQQVQKVADEQYLKLKVEDLKKEVQDLQGDIQNMGVVDLKEVNEKLQEKLESIRKMRNECAVLLKEVDYYGNLPPSLAKAKEVLMQAKQDYENVCKQLNSKITQQRPWKPGQVPI